MQPLPDVAALLAELSAFADVVEKVVSAEMALDWHWRPAEGEWNLTELVCHLRDVEREVHQPRFEAVMQTDNPFLTGATTDQWVQTRDYATQNGPAAATNFVAARRETLAMLPASDSPVWLRGARHAFLGPTSMHELLQLVIQHDRAHLPQLKALKKS